MIRRNKGFTLVELLLGLGIFATIITAVYGTFWGGIRLSHRSEITDQVFQEVRMSLDLMERELENMTSYNFLNSYEDQLSFKGSSSKITFLLGTDEGLKFVSYYLVSEENEHIHQILINESTDGNVDLELGNIQEEEIQYLIREETSFVDYVTDQEKEDVTEVELIASHVRADSLKFTYGFPVEAVGSDSVQFRNYETTDNWEFERNPITVTIDIEFVIDAQEEQILSFSKEVFIPIFVSS